MKEMWNMGLQAAHSRIAMTFPVKRLEPEMRFPGKLIRKRKYWMSFLLQISCKSTCELYTKATKLLENIYSRLDDVIHLAFQKALLEDVLK